ncbi:MAG: hypothetical protein ABW076_10350 [Candidatus Thiodiazotropha sp.]
MTLPDGRELYLGHMVVMHTFLLPYFVESKGLVLGIVGDSHQYIPVPEGKKLLALQTSGLLPKTLPTPKLTITDYIFSLSLEIAILIFIGYPLLKWAFRKSRV